MSTHRRVVAAALAETKDKFRIAEALAMDIPPSGDDASVRQQLLAVREEILEAGGEPRSYETLKQYRSTALWVRKNGKFLWVAGASYTAHTSARAKGLTRKNLYDLVKKVGHVGDRELRDLTGGASKDGNPSKVSARWTPAQQAEAVKAMLSNPDTAKAVVSDLGSRAAFAKAQFTWDSEQEARVNEDRRTDPMKKAQAKGLTRSELEKLIAHAVFDLSQLATKLIETSVDDTLVSTLMPDVDRSEHLLGWIIDVLKSGSAALDDEIAALLTDES